MHAGKCLAGLGLLVFFLLALDRTPHAAAAVLPQSRIAAAFASAPKLHRRPVPHTRLIWPYYKLDGSDAQGFVVPDRLDYGFLANGADAFIVPLESGGSGGVFSTLVFTALGTKPTFVGAIPSANGHLDVHIERGRIVVRTPIYRAADPNCCPSGHHVTAYALVSGKLKKLEEYKTP